MLRGVFRLSLFLVGFFVAGKFDYLLQAHVFFAEGTAAA